MTQDSFIYLYLTLILTLYFLNSSSAFKIPGQFVSVAGRSKLGTKPSSAFCGPWIMASPAAPSTAAPAAPSNELFVSLGRPPSLFVRVACTLLRDFPEIKVLALEGAIVTAVDTAFVLQRRRFAEISQIQTDQLRDSGRGAKSRITIVLSRTEEYLRFLETQADELRGEGVDVEEIYWPAPDDAKNTVTTF
eukprot:scaffold7522_cov267-Pinguiococcus_pyrenoidosus.AAC.3